jgi:hypothetical protein
MREIVARLWLQNNCSFRKRSLASDELAGGPILGPGRETKKSGKSFAGSLARTAMENISLS